ncbi:hypothetical protein TNCV_2735421 [Trichonephila clavipes]|nr:hypothetical protein TNCV_2735421 [Trichonephila clavipes]
MKKYCTPEAQGRILTNDTEKLPSKSPAGATYNVGTDKRDTPLDSPGEIVPYREPMTRSRSRNKILVAVDRRRYSRAKNRFWSDQEEHEGRGLKDLAASFCGPHSDSLNDTSRRRRSNCSTNNFQPLAEADFKSKRPFRALP